MENLFEACLPLLQKIYGAAAIQEKEQHLRDLFMETETVWHANLARYKNQPVNCILITEAPCTEGDASKYFYNRIETSFHQKIWKAIFPNDTLPADMETAYTMLAGKGFLLIDSIPFSLKYAGKRDKKAYTELLANCAQLLVDKLNNKKISIGDNAIAAFAFKVNGLKLIEATGGKLALNNGKEITLSENHIAADASGYTNSALLRQIFGL